MLKNGIKRDATGKVDMINSLSITDWMVADTKTKDYPSLVRNLLATINMTANDVWLKRLTRDIYSDQTATKNLNLLKEKLINDYKFIN